MTNKIEGMGGKDKEIPVTPTNNSIKIEKKHALKANETMGVSDVQQDGEILSSGNNPIQASNPNIEKLTNVLNDEMNKLEQLHDVSDKLTEADLTKPLDTIAKEQGQALYEFALANMQAVDNWGEFTGGVQKIPDTAMEYAMDYYTTPVLDFLEPLGEVGKAELNGAIRLIQTNLILKIPKTLNAGGALIAKRIILTQIEKEFEKKKDKLSEKQSTQLSEWIKAQKKQLNQEALKFGKSMMLTIPNAVRTLAAAFGSVGDVFKLTNSAVIGVLNIADKTYGLYVAHKEMQTHEDWVERFEEKPLVKEPISDKKNSELANAVNTLLQKRNAELIERMKKLNSEFTKWAFDLANAEKPFEEIKQDFLKKGIDLTNLKDPIDNHEKLLQKLNIITQEDVTLANEMLRNYSEKAITLSIVTRNGLQVMAAKKHKIERKFMHFNLGKKAFFLSTSAIVFTATIVLKALAIAAIIAIPTAALAFTGVGIFVLGIAALAIGLLILHYYKPNLCGQILRGVQIKLALYTIPHAFQSFRLSLNKIKKLKAEMKFLDESTQIEEIEGILRGKNTTTAKDFPKELRSVLKKFKVDNDEQLQNPEELLKKLNKIKKEEWKRITKEQNKLEKKIEQIEANLEIWKKKIAPLKGKLRNAAWKDFEKTLTPNAAAWKKYEESLLKNELSDTGKENIKKNIDEKKNVKIDQELTNALFYDREYLDETTEKLLQQQFGIDIKNLREKLGDGAEEGVKEAFKTFFAMDESAVIKFIKQQNTKFNFGEAKK